MRPRLPSSVHFTLPKSAKYGNPGKLGLLFARDLRPRAYPTPRHFVANKRVSPTLGCGGAPWSGGWVNRESSAAEEDSLLRSIAEVDVLQSECDFKGRPLPEKASRAHRVESVDIGQNRRPRKETLVGQSIGGSRGLCCRPTALPDLYLA